jgi:ABC-type uncharacterized transport system substrate-binding protein
MRRLAVALLPLALLVAPLAVEAQQTSRDIPRVALVAPAGPVPDFSNPNVRAFRDALREHGYTDGQNVRIELRSAEGKWDQAPKLFAGLVEQRVSVIVVPQRLIRAARDATSTIPIVVAGFGLVAQGHAATLARPGGNLTGVDLEDTGDIMAKRFQLLKEIAPRVRRIAVLSAPYFFKLSIPNAQQLVQAAGITLVPIPADTQEEPAEALKTVTRERLDAIQPDSGFLYPQRRRLADFALANRIPMVGADRGYPEEGALMSFGTNLIDASRLAARYVAQILGGARPGDLPIERPTKFEFVLNRKTAKALGLTIPPSVLARADEVIQ